MKMKKSDGKIVAANAPFIDDGQHSSPDIFAYEKCHLSRNRAVKRLKPHLGKWVYPM